jgi:hypothetical protein
LSSDKRREIVRFQIFPRTGGETEIGGIGVAAIDLEDGNDKRSLYNYIQPG